MSLSLGLLKRELNSHSRQADDLDNRVIRRQRSCDNLRFTSLLKKTKLFQRWHSIFKERIAARRNIIFFCSLQTYPLPFLHTHTQPPPPTHTQHSTAKKLLRSRADRTTSPVTLRSSLFSLSVKQVSKCQHGREPAISVRHDLFGRSVNDCSFSVNLRQR